MFVLHTEKVKISRSWGMSANSIAFCSESKMT